MNHHQHFEPHHIIPQGKESATIEKMQELTSNLRAQIQNIQIRKMEHLEIIDEDIEQGIILAHNAAQYKKATAEHYAQEEQRVQEKFLEEIAQLHPYPESNSVHSQ